MFNKVKKVQHVHTKPLMYLEAESLLMVFWSQKRFSRKFSTFKLKITYFKEFYSDHPISACLELR